METHQSWKLRFSFKNATIFVCLLNLVTALFLLQGFFSPSSSSRRYPPNHPNSVELMYVKESEEIRRAMQPFELIRRKLGVASRGYASYIEVDGPLKSEEVSNGILILQVREIEQESYAEPETVQHKEMKQTAAVDLSKRLTNIRSFSDAASVKALEEWRKRKMERARQREMGRNATAAS